MKIKTVPVRKDVPAADRWDLTPLFRSDADWEAFYIELDRDIATYDAFRGTLHRSVDQLRQGIEFHLRLTRRVERLYTYAHLKSDEDKSDQFYMGCYQKALGLLTRASERSSFIPPEIQSISDRTLHRFLQDPSLEEFCYYIEKILRDKPHTLDEKTESILAMSRDATRACPEIFGQLDTVDMTFGTIADGAGNQVELSHGNFITFLMHPNREIRKTAFYQYYRAYGEHKHTLAATLAYSVKADHFYSRVRNFASCRAAALFEDDVSETVYDNLIQTVKRNLGPLFTYLHFRKRCLGLDALLPYDIHVPVIQGIDYETTYDTGVQTCIQALSPLGIAYTRPLGQGLRGGWVDRYENRGKRSGAYSSGCFDSPPYILLNYQDRNLDSLYTLIHEAGHSMHSYFSIQSQPYVDHQYTIFAAEVASTFNEILLTRHLLDRYAGSPRMTVYILNREIDNIRATLIRQTMFAEFELIVHRRVEKNQPLTLENLTRLYRNLLETYFGDAVKIDPALELECLRIPHFYRSFYVYQYATGVSAAIALADRVLTEGEGARDTYLNFLTLGGSKFPIDELLQAGVDMRTPEPVDRAMAYFERLTSRLMDAYGRL